MRGPTLQGSKETMPRQEARGCEARRGGSTGNEGRCPQGHTPAAAHNLGPPAASPAARPILCVPQPGVIRRPPGLGPLWRRRTRRGRTRPGPECQVRGGRAGDPGAGRLAGRGLGRGPPPVHVTGKGPREQSAESRPQHSRLDSRLVTRPTGPHVHFPLSPWGLCSTPFLHSLVKYFSK